MLAFLEMREQRWTHGLVEAEAQRRGSDPEERLLDIFDEWFHRDDFDACSFINVLLEMGPQHPAGDASVEYLDHIRSIVRRFADEASLRDTELYTRDPVWDVSSMGTGTFRGADLICRELEQWMTLYEHFEIEVQEIRDMGCGVILAVQDMAGRLLASNSNVEMRFASRERVEGGDDHAGDYVPRHR